MSGETRIVVFAEGTPTDAPAQTFLTTSAFQNYASDAAFVTAKNSAAAQGDSYFNTTDKTVHLYNNTYWSIIDAIKKNLASAVDPTSTDDSASNYSVGSSWFNTALGTWHLAKTVGVGTATWSELIDKSTSQTIENKSFKALTTFVVDESDVTKKMKFDAASIANATTRTIKMLDMDGTFVFIGLKAAISAHSRYEGALWWATDENKLYGDDGANLTNIGSGGGSSLLWRNDDELAAIEETIFGILCYGFSPGETQKITTVMKVPDSYSPGAQIRAKGKFFARNSGGNILLQTTATLVRNGVDIISSTTNQRVSTNSAETIVTGDLEYIVIWDISSTIGQINAVGISANDSIKISVSRATDTSTETAYIAPSSIEVLI